MDLIEGIVSRVECIERELGNAAESGEVNPTKAALGEIENRIDQIEKRIKEFALQEKRGKAPLTNITDGIEIRIERIEMEMKDTPGEKNGTIRDALPARVKQNKCAEQDCSKAIRNFEGCSTKEERQNPIGVLNEMANRIERIEREMKDVTPQEKRFKALLMSVLNEITNRVERIEGELRNAPLLTKDKVPMMARTRLPGPQDIMTFDNLKANILQEKREKNMVDDFGYQAKQMECKMRRNVSREKRENNLLYEIAHRVERIESEMREAYLQTDKASLSAVVDEIVNRVERMEKDLRSVVGEIANRVQCMQKAAAIHGLEEKGDDASMTSLMDAMDEIANRVERMEIQMMSALQEKRDKMSSTFVAEDNSSGMMRMRRETGEYAAQADHEVLPMETEKAAEEQGSRSSQSGLSSLENVRNKETELRLRKCVFCNGNHWQEQGRRYSSSS